MDLTWSNLGSFAGASAVGAAAIGLMLWGWLVGKIVTPERMNKLEERVEKVEKLADAAATHEDLTEVHRRLGAVEMTLAGMQATVNGTHHCVARIERQFDIFLESALQREKSDAR